MLNKIEIARNQKMIYFFEIASKCSIFSNVGGGGVKMISRIVIKPLEKNKSVYFVKSSYLKSEMQKFDKV